MVPYWIFFFGHFSCQAINSSQLTRQCLRELPSGSRRLTYHSPDDTARWFLHVPYKYIFHLITTIGYKFSLATNKSMQSEENCSEILPHVKQRRYLSNNNPQLWFFLVKTICWIAISHLKADGRLLFPTYSTIAYTVIHWLISLFNDISTFVGYSMPKLSFQRNSSDAI